MPKQYTIEFTHKAMRQGEKLSIDLRRRVFQAIKSLATHPFPQGAIKITNSNYYRIRVGDYRIIYEVENDRLKILIIRIGHRKEIYRGI